MANCHDTPVNLFVGHSLSGWLPDFAIYLTVQHIQFGTPVPERIRPG